MKILGFVGILIGVGLLGCTLNNTSQLEINSTKPPLALSQQKTWSLMVGTWYGSQPTKEGGKKEEIMKRSPDGTYRITFRVYDKSGNYSDDTEVGYWGVSGPVYFTIFRGWIEAGRFSASDSSDPYNYDAYKIIKLNDKVFEYEAYSTSDRFADKRVHSDFKFPS